MSGLLLILKPGFDYSGVEGVSEVYFPGLTAMTSRHWANFRGANHWR